MKTRTLLSAAFIVTAALTHATEPDPGFIAHEWGTFTSVQGADGVQMIWNPEIAPELPQFVYHWPDFTKLGSATRQRMETPVIYFYSDRELTLDVTVRFPQGRITEWYPDSTAAGLPFVAPEMLNTKLALHWKNVQVQPADKPLPLLTDTPASHYYAARETDASTLRTVSFDRKTDAEKFLFYRGVAAFNAPLTVKLNSADARKVTLTNGGAEPLQNLFLYEVRADGSLSWMLLDKLAAGTGQSLDLNHPTGASAETLAAALRGALVGQGLYEKEAVAMVKTWESAWFQERGMRVVYLLPRPWTDRTLPLAITPVPKSVERVMVARAEIITPAVEAALLQKIERYIAAAPKDRAAIVEETRSLGLGRFTNVVLSRLHSGTQRSPEFTKLAWELVRAATASPQLKEVVWSAAPVGSLRP